MRKFIGLICVLALAVGFGGAANADPPNLVSNGSFEEGTCGGDFVTLDQGDSEISPWDITAEGDNAIDWICTYWQAADGDWSVDMNGLQQGTIEQALDTTPAGKYVVTFSLAGNPMCGSTIKTLSVSAAGDAETYTFDTDGKSLPVIGWEDKLFSFTATDEETTLLFESQDVTTDTRCGPALDDVSAFLVGLSKEITSGENRPDALDGSGEPDLEIDLVLPVPGAESMEYDFTITLVADPETPDVLVYDTVPAEWQVVEVAGNDVDEEDGGFLEGEDDGMGGTVNVYPANMKGNSNKNINKSATKIEWTPNPAALMSSLNVVITTRERPKGHGRNADLRWAPTSCGRLYLNDGAIGYEIDEFGELVLDGEGNPVVVHEQTAPLFLIAVSDVNEDGIIDRTGAGDEDGDGFSDGEDNCPCVVNPGQEDADNDGIGDVCDTCTDIDGDGYGNTGYDNMCPNDCDDSDASINPDATETCNGIDDDCDGQTDEGCPT